MTKLATLYDEFCQKRFPKMGKSVGHFPLYDGYFSGYVSTFLQTGARPELAAMEPDDQSATVIEALRQKRILTTDEREFLDYVKLMDRIRAEVFAETAA